MPVEWMIVGVLAVWRITHLLAHEDGPFDLVIRMRRALGDSLFGHLMDCFYCLSLWVALGVAAAMEATVAAPPSLAEVILLWPALSGGAVLLERATQRPAAAPTPPDDLTKE